MQNKIYKFLLLKLLFNIVIINIANAKPKIVTTTTPVAGIVAMLTQDSAEVVSINTSGGCPHHHHLKPSDINKIKDADIIIYIDEKFDGEFQKLIKKSNNNKAYIIKISDIAQINLTDEVGKTNYHFWLDLNNILPVQNEVANILFKINPEIKQIIIDNQAQAQKDINELMSFKKAELAHLPELIVASDSLEHFFVRTGLNIIKAYNAENGSLQSYANLKQILKLDHQQCIILDLEQNPDIYKKFNKNIVQLDSENWQIDGIIKYDLYFQQYIKMINDLKNCKKQ